MILRNPEGVQHTTEVEIIIGRCPHSFANDMMASNEAPLMKLQPGAITEIRKH